MLVKPTARQVPARTRLLLFVRAVGRCEFDGCSQYLLEYNVADTARKRQGVPREGKART